MAVQGKTHLREMECVQIATCRLYFRDLAGFRGIERPSFPGVEIAMFVPKWCFLPSEMRSFRLLWSSKNASEVLDVACRAPFASDALTHLTD